MFDTLKIRCSSIGYIMTEPKSKKEGLSETCRGHLADLFVSTRYNRRTDNTNKYTLKGNLVEEDSMTLYSLFKKRPFFKNKERLENEWVIGSPDIIHGDTIIDIKSSWDIFTFFRNKDSDKLNKNYYWQMQGYMALTGATRAVLAYCLVNTPDSIITDEKRRLFYRMNAATEDNKDYQAACEELERLMIYDDIPQPERVIEIEILRDDKAIDSVYSRVDVCRQYMADKYGHYPLLIAHHDNEVKATIIQKAS